MHDLSAAELEVGGIDFATKDLVECGCSGEDDRLSLDLGGTFT